jgi:mannose-6-phosphate isomerase-like protein (cupin superfamily)
MARARTAASKKSAAKKSAAKKSNAKKSATEKSATKNSMPRRKTAASKSAPRRGAVAKAPARKAAKARPRTVASRPPQRFVVSHHRDEDFATGLRRYAQYRDLGIAAASHGLAQAHVIRLIGPCDPAEVSKLHFHDVEFQMVYVLKGWVKAQFEGPNLEGNGEIVMREGSCWTQPPRIKHMILDYSDNCELLEIILPAEFETVELAG